ncbi:4Fe-4S protein [Jonquetella anthropi DSM 22815]|uniref:4Fe-4S protein n=1 Tax=Jonquetella anthropi DSM 22815 TaxID=885272 RepID=H0UKE5_9BACT|nr:4Fe-4S binding protein [Jonquetella anthropi]EHM13154.1 4Fe-4S protein [Jonquetella anthropi DSM 22815]
MSPTQGKLVRRIIRIDEEKCDGCGQCATACHENAIEIINGKAKLVSDTYCDGLGDCLGQCPRGAISFEEREADAYDAAAVAQRVASRTVGAKTHPCTGGCPGSAARRLFQPAGDAPAVPAAVPAPALQHAGRLSTWPVQLRLVPPGAPFLAGANWVLAADCVAYAYRGFHDTFLADGTVCLIGCPKLDDTQAYETKLAQMITVARPASLTVALMEVPCCSRLALLAEKAIEAARVSLEYRRVQLSLRGDVLSDRTVEYRFA